MSQQRRLRIAGFVIAGLLSHSLSVLAAGGDFITDSLAIALGVFAVYMRDKRGNKMALSYVALVNVLLLLGVTTAVIIKTISRLVLYLSLSWRWLRGVNSWQRRRK